MRHVTGMILAVLCLAGCAGDGTNEQVVTVTSDPPGASCNVSRENVDLGTVPATPGSLKVSKGVTPLIVACTAAGSETITGGFEARYRGAPQTNSAVLFNTTTTVGSPAAVDPRYYSYPSNLMITLRR